MRALGFQKVRTEPCLVPVWERGDVERLELVAAGSSVPLRILALGGSVGTPKAGIEGEVLMLRSFEELDRLGDEKVRGKVVFFNRPMPRALRSTFAAYGRAVPQRVSGAARAGKYGAVACIVRSMTTAIDDVPHTGVMRYDRKGPRIPAAAVSTIGAQKIARALSKGLRPRLRLTLSCRNLPDRPSSNVIGELVGTEAPDEYLLIGGHLDSWDVGQGAHDDGAGVVQSLEALRLLTEHGYRPRRSIRCVLFMNEENGLRGALAYAKAHENDQHIAAIESDNGGFLPLGFSTTLRGEAFDRLKARLEPLGSHGAGSLIRGGGGADIGPIVRTGVPGFSLLVSSHRYFDFHHSERDRIEAVNERELELGAAIMSELLRLLDRDFEAPSPGGR